MKGNYRINNPFYGQITGSFYGGTFKFGKICVEV